MRSPPFSPMSDQRFIGVAAQVMSRPKAQSLPSGEGVGRIDGPPPARVLAATEWRRGSPINSNAKSKTCTYRAQNLHLFLTHNS